MEYGKKESGHERKKRVEGLAMLGHTECRKYPTIS